MSILSAVEALCWLFAAASMHLGNSFRFYHPTELARQVEAHLQIERDAPDTGWGGMSARLHPPLAMKQCASAWGGSYTVSDGVSDIETWPYLASLKLGCVIDNFGVDGFGFDQTLMLFQNNPTHHSTVILGMAQPMIWVGGVSSWAFLDLKSKQPQWKVTKPLFRIENQTLRFYPRPDSTLDAVLTHYRNDDYARGWTPLRFPFFLSVAHALYKKRSVPNLLRYSAMDDLPALKAQRDVATATIVAMAKAASENDDRFVVLLVPRPEDSSGLNPAFSAMLQSLAQQMPAACLIDPSAELRRAALGTSGTLMNADRHFDFNGNAALADALVNGITRCGLTPMIDRRHRPGACFTSSPETSVYKRRGRWRKADE